MKRKETLKTLINYFGFVLVCAGVCVSLSGCSLAARVIKNAADITQDSAEDMAPDFKTEDDVEESEKTEEIIEELLEEVGEFGEFEGFINGTESAIVDEGVSLGYDDFDSENCGKSFTFEELNDYMINSEYYTHNPSIYTCLMKKDDGSVLLLKYDGMDIYCEDDDSFVVFALTSKKDGFHITYNVESWCRNVVEINAEGIISSEGSSGAGDHGADKGYLDTMGQYNEIFSVEECGSGWICSMFEYHMDVDFSTDTQNHAFEVDLEDNNIVALYTMDGQIYGTIEYSDTQAASALVESAEKDGVIWVDATEIDDLIEDYEEALGLTDDMNVGEPDWILVKEAEEE